MGVATVDSLGSQDCLTPFEWPLSKKTEPKTQIGPVPGAVVVFGQFHHEYERYSYETHTAV